jgi:hypothetical protein
MRLHLGMIGAPLSGLMTKASSIGGNVTPSKATTSTAPRRAVTRPSIVLVLFHCVISQADPATQQ